MREVIKKEQVRVGESRRIPAPGGAGGSHACAGGAPGLRLVRVDGRVHSIEHTCRCGSVSILEIEYEDAAATPEEAS